MWAIAYMYILYEQIIFHSFFLYVSYYYLFAGFFFMVLFCFISDF